MKKPTKLFAGTLALIVLIVAAICSYAQFVPSDSVLTIQGSRTEGDKTPATESFYSYPIMFDGQILDYADFKMKSHGRLSIVRVTRDAADATAVPFYIFLRRNDTIVKQCNVNLLTQPVKSIEISNILSFSKAGDVLIIVPMAKPDGKTKITFDLGC